MSDNKRNLDNPKWAHKAARRRKATYRNARDIVTVQGVTGIPNR